MMLEFAVGLIIFLSVIYAYLTRNYDYWKKKGVPFVKPKFPLDLFHDQVFGNEDVGTSLMRYYTHYKAQGLKYFGAFHLLQPVLIIIDLDLCKQILTKDFNHFMDRDLNPETHEYITKTLFSLGGQSWKDLRIKLTPSFSSGKIKGMAPLIVKCIQQLEQYIDDVVLEKSEEGVAKVKDLFSRFTTDVIASIAFGIEVNTLKNPDHEFYEIGKLVFKPTNMDLVKMLLHRNIPTIARFLKVDFYHPNIAKNMYKTIKATVSYRRDNKITRNDFLEHVLNINNSDMDAYNKTVGHEMKNSENITSLNMEEITAQAFTFLSAGHETSASTISFCLYELAKNQNIQERLRKEIDNALVKYEGEVTYQSLSDMTYMDQVMNETWRRYAILPALDRKCTQTYKLPGTDLVIEQGVKVEIPTYAIQHDPEIFPNPFKFDPDRFSEENAKNRHPYSLLPFGEGPRICIGARFAKVLIKILLATILSRYEFSPCEDTPPEITIRPDKIFTTAKENYSLRITKRTL